MRKILLILMLILPLFAHSEDRKSKSELLKAFRHYQRLMESAQPTPSGNYFKDIDPPSIMSPKSNSVFFKNVNTIDDESQETYRMQNESSIAVNPKNPLNLVASAVDYRASSSTWVYVSSDGGKSWVNHNLGKPFEGWRSSNDPSVYFSADGIAYMCYGGFGESVDSFAVNVAENAVFLAKSYDEGKTWKAHIPVILHRGVQTLDSTFEDKYYVQVDNSPSSPYFNHLYIPWKRVTPRDSATQIVISKSTDEGETWSTPLGVSHRLAGSSEDTTFGQSFPLTTTGPNGEVYLVWNHGIEHGIGFAKSLDGGISFTDPKIIIRYNIFGTTRLIEGQGYRHTVKEKVRAEAYPVIIADNTTGPNRGNLYLCWAADSIPNIYFSRSIDGGESWSPPIIAQSDTTNDQFWPWMAIDPLSGDLAIMYFDSRNFEDNMMVECYVSYSNDAGLTWSDRRAADHSNDLRLNPFSGNAFAGDYSGCAFYDGYVYPSWVDMRSAAINISDSDVFTAIINTQAPMPCEDFRATIFPDNPTAILLEWENPTEKSFGQSLANADYQLKIVRNGEIAHTLPGGTNKLMDDKLDTYKKFDYEIYAISNNDSSISRSLVTYSGGSKEPAAPVIISSTGSADFTTSLTVKVPNLRADGVTAFANLQTLKIYRDGAFLRDETVSSNDTGKVISIIDNPAMEGYYKYTIAAIDNMGNASTQSAIFLAYSGEVKYYEEKIENFDAATLPKYFIGGMWLPTTELSTSKPYSFSNAPNIKYKDNQADTLMIFPFITNSDDYYVIFNNAAILATNDYATLEYSTDHGISWSNEFNGKIAKWNKSHYPAWEDKILNDLDWKLEEFKMPKTNDTIQLRWRFYANQFVNDQGWYIDDIKLSRNSVSVASDLLNSGIAVYPNPAKDYLKVKVGTNSGDYGYKLLDPIGETVLTGTQNSNEFGELSLNLNNLTSGAYYLILECNGKSFRAEPVMIIR